MPIDVRNFVVALACLAATAGLRAAELPFIYQDWEVFTTRDGLPHDAVRSIGVHGEQVWVGTDGGLAVREDGRWRTWTHLDPQHSIPMPTISALDFDPGTGDAWLGTWGSGLLRFTAGRFDRFDQLNSGLAGNLVFAVLVTNGRVWAATNGGLSIFDPRDDTWDLILERRAAGPELPLLSLVPEPGGAGLYAAAWCAGLYRIDARGGVANSVPAPWEAAADTTLVVAQADGTTWWVTQARLGRHVASAPWEVREIAGPGPPNGFVGCAAARSATEIWLGTDHGLRVLADWPTDTWVTYRRSDGGSTTLVAVTRAGTALETHVLTAGLPDNRIHCVAFQGDDVWVGTPHGLAHGKRCQEPFLRSTRRAAAREKVPDTFSPSIGVLSSVSRTMPLPGQNTAEGGCATLDVSAVQLAVEEANARGGYRGTIPFTVVTDPYGYARYGWTLPEDDLATLAYASPVCGIVGYVGPNRRFTTAAAWRTEVPLVNAADGPATIDESVNPWMFRATCAARSDPDARARFAARFTARFQRVPRAEAFASYVAAEHLLRAIELAGPERDAIRRALDQANRTTAARLDAGR